MRPLSYTFIWQPQVITCSRLLMPNPFPHARSGRWMGCQAVRVKRFSEFGGPYESGRVTVTIPAEAVSSKSGFGFGRCRGFGRDRAVLAQGRGPFGDGQPDGL